MKNVKKKSPAGRVFPDPTPALVRARKAAVELARQTGTAVVMAKDGRIVKVYPKPRAKRAKSGGHRG